MIDDVEWYTSMAYQNAIPSNGMKIILNEMKKKTWYLVNSIMVLAISVLPAHNEINNNAMLHQQNLMNAMNERWAYYE